MSDLVAGRRVLITAAGHGMGRAIAHRMVREGAAAVALVDRDQDRLARVREELTSGGARVFTYALDLLSSRDANRACVQRAIADMGGLEVLVSHAGGATQERFLETKDESLDRQVALNFTVGFVLAQEAARHMAQHGGGVILFTASTVDSGGFPEVPVYSATKAALINLVKAIAPELARHNIRVNSVSPGLTDSRAEDGSPYAPEVAGHLPMGRPGRPDEVAAAFAFLASDDASYITGENLNVHGALTTRAHGVAWSPASLSGPFTAVSGTIGQPGARYGGGVQ